MLKRYSSRTKRYRQTILLKKLENAQSYDRIAGYFSSSILEIAGESLKSISGKIRVVCNSHLEALDVKTANAAVLTMTREWKTQIDKLYDEQLKSRLSLLYELLRTGKLEVKVLPNESFGLMHGKAGVITMESGERTSFLGSANETKAGWQLNYELVWEDNDEESVSWVQDEFNALWHHKLARPLSEAIINDIDRLSGRKEVSFKQWRNEKDLRPALVESPVFRHYNGLWPHQKYFVHKAFQEFKSGRGTRMILADQVGLGKTVQMAAAAMLMSLSTGRSGLIIAPKTLIYQWQDELMKLLHLPSAIWTGRHWVDENQIKYPDSDPIRAIKNCPRLFGIISQGLITHENEAVQKLLDIQFECVIVDEAHRCRRSNLKKDSYEKPDPNNLMKYLLKLSSRCNNMILGTATPMQLYPIELHDLLTVLSAGSSHVLGNELSKWQRANEFIFRLVSGEEEIINYEQLWDYIRNPFPPARENELLFGTIRDELRMASNKSTIKGSRLNQLGHRPKERLFEENNLFQKHNPFIRSIIRRTRTFLEETNNPETGEPYLKKVRVQLFGESNDEAILLPGYLKDAYDAATEFCTALNKIMPGSGFIKTLLLRRMGSSIIAGKNTALKMRGESFHFDEHEDDDGIEQLSGIATKIGKNERDILEKLVHFLERDKLNDPKFEVLSDLLFQKQWHTQGCIIFSQYFDTAAYFAELTASKHRELKIGLYAGADKSGYWLNKHFARCKKEYLKGAVTSGEIKLLFGTDSASEGLNLQRLGTLINLDLPWNPTKLEQRKGRIQRIGQVLDSVKVYNMRYKDSVEDRVHEILSERLQGLYDIFGQIPDILEDVWVDVAVNDLEEAKRRINKVETRSSFEIKYDQIQDFDFETCKKVVNQHDIDDVLYKAW
ncbi:MAG: phospholipase D-like domain-containing anti-phage protein [Thermodesulfobacteriota bacterium]|nr:phospholipase D-like domain-containing anti-phage protein [Thermodesulfobacteriota bacterium]